MMNMKFAKELEKTRELLMFAGIPTSIMMAVRHQIEIEWSDIRKLRADVGPQVDRLVTDGMLKVQRTATSIFFSLPEVVS